MSTPSKAAHIVRFNSVSDIDALGWAPSSTHPVSGLPLNERRKVLLAYDTSPHGDLALEWCYDNLLQDERDHIIIVTAVEAQTMITTLFKDEQELRQHSKSKYECISAIHEAFSTLCSKRNITCQHFLLEGDPREVILDVADRTNADCIVVGARGLSTLERAVMGSCSTHLVQHSPVPVVVARRRPTSKNTSKSNLKAGETLPLTCAGNLTEGTAVDWISFKKMSIEKRKREIGVSEKPSNPNTSAV